MKSQKILIVDDIPANLHALTQVLRDTEATIVRAQSGQEALAATLEHEFALAILDVQMPGMNGYELAELLRGNPDTRTIPIIFLTAASYEDQQVFKGYEAGAVDYVIKPYRAEIMYSKASIFLELHAQKKELERGQRLLEERVRERTTDLEMEIVSRKAAQLREEHVNSLLRTSRKIHQLIQREHDRHALIKGACTLLLETRGYRGTWIALGECHTPSACVAQAGWNSSFDDLEHQLLRGQWPICCETSSVDSRSLSQPGKEKECQKCPLGSDSVEYGHLVFSLDHTDRHYGMLVVSLPVEAAADAEEQQLLAGIAKDLAFALHDIELLRSKQQSEAENHALYEQAPILLLLVDAAGKVRKANRKALEWAGIEEIGTLSKGQLLHCLHAEDSPQGCGAGALCRNCKLRIAVIQALQEGRENLQQSLRLQQRLESGEQCEIQFLLSATPLHVGEERLVQVCLMDVSDLRKSEEARLAESRRAQQYLDVAGVILLAVDFGGTVTMINPKGAEVLGYSLHEIVGENWIERYVPKEERDTVRATLQGLLSGAKQAPSSSEGHIVTHDNSARIIAWSHTVIQNDSGEITGILSSGEDITERRQNEEERMQLQEQLQQAQKMESIGRLAGGVAHDFNNMLSIILGYCENINEQLREGDPLYQDVLQIQEAGLRSAALTRQLLAFSRKQTLKPDVLDLNKLITNLERMLRRLIGEDIALSLSLNEELDRVLADTGQVEQVLMNLAVNARDAMPTGGKLLIETANVELDEAYAQSHISCKPGPYVLLAVSDSGCGMSRDTIAQIFDPFFTTKEQGKGTGLGLSTVYGIVKQSGGNIWVYSEEGKGTSFKIYLPKCAMLETAVQEAPREIHCIKGERILLVEDEAALRKLAQSVLERLGFQISIAADGEEALRLFSCADTRPNLVITDVIMPGMSGKELVERMRAIDPELRVLYMSGYTDNAIVQHGILDSGTPFIQKPFSIRDLAAKAQEALQS